MNEPESPPSEHSRSPAAPGAVAARAPRPRLVVLARVALLLCALVAVFASVVIAKRRGVYPGARYACPMHPEITARDPGECSICGMALSRIGEPPTESDASGASLASLSSAELSLAGEPLFVVKPVVFSLSIRAPAFVESSGVVSAHLYNDEIRALPRDEPGTFRRADAAIAAVDLGWTSEPTLSWDGATSVVRFRVEPSSKTRVGVVGWVEFPSRARKGLLVPYAAVLQSAAGPYVLARAGDGGLEHRPIALGRVFFGQAAVLSGLSEGDRIVTRNPYFLAAELRLHAALDQASPAP